MTKLLFILPLLFGLVLAEGPSLEEEMGGGRGHGAEEFPQEEWTGYTPTQQQINIPDPNLPTLGEIEGMNESQLEIQRNRLIQYQSDWGMELSVNEGRTIGNTVRRIDDQLEVIREDPNRYDDRDEREPQQPYFPRTPSRDNEIESLKTQTEGLGFPSYVMEEPIVSSSIERLLRIGIRPRSILDGYTYFLNKERESNPRFSIQGNMGELASFYNRAIPDSGTANQFNQQLDKSWSLLESSTGRRPSIEPPVQTPQPTPPEEPVRETDPSYMGAAHIPAPSPEEMAGGERYIYDAVRGWFENPANRPLDPRDTRGQLPGGIGRP